MPQHWAKRSRERNHRMNDEAISLLLQELKGKDIRLQLDGGKLRLNAPKGAVNDQLKKMIASNREFLIARLQSDVKVNGPGFLSRVPRAGRLPVTFAQQRLWFLDQVDPGRSHYNIFFAFEIKGWLDIAALERGLVTLSRRHETLRTRIGEQDGAPWVEIDDHLLPTLVRHDVCDLPSAERELQVRRLVLSFGQEPFDLARGPLARYMLVALGADALRLRHGHASHRERRLVDIHPYTRAHAALRGLCRRARAGSAGPGAVCRLRGLGATACRRRQLRAIARFLEAQTRRRACPHRVADGLPPSDGTVFPRATYASRYFRRAAW